MHNTNPPCTHLGQGLLGRVLWLAEQLFNHAAGLCHSRSQVLVRVGPHGLDEGPLHGGLGLKQLHFLVQGQVIERRVHGVNTEEWHAWVENKQAVVVPAALIRKIRWEKNALVERKKALIPSSLRSQDRDYAFPCKANLILVKPIQPFTIFSHA